MTKTFAVYKGYQLHAFYDHANGLIGYPNKLAQAVSNYAGAYYSYIPKNKLIHRDELFKYKKEE